LKAKHVTSTAKEVNPKKPSWLRVRVPGGPRYNQLKAQFGQLKLHTVCEEARCPNIGECWSEGTATLMLLGDICTRGCRFCSVNSGKPAAVDLQEPDNVAAALRNMDLAYVVLTMVDRDDLADGGAAHVAQTIRKIRRSSPDTLIEALVGDFAGKQKPVQILVEDGAPDVFAHNVEVVPRLQRAMRDTRCSWQRSLDTLQHARDMGAQVTKTSLMVGCGERPEEVSEALLGLREANVDVVTIGQYLRPTPKHAPVKRYVEPAEFDSYRDEGLRLGFKFVASGPLVRSSYRAAEAFLKGILTRRLPTHEQLPYDDRYGKKRHLSILG